MDRQTPPRTLAIQVHSIVAVEDQSGTNRLRTASCRRAAHSVDSDRVEDIVSQGSQVQIGFASPMHGFPGEIVRGFEKVSCILQAQADLTGRLQPGFLPGVFSAPDVLKSLNGIQEKISRFPRSGGSDPEPDGRPPILLPAAPGSQDPSKRVPAFRELSKEFRDVEARLSRIVTMSLDCFHSSDSKLVMTRVAPGADFGPADLRRPGCFGLSVRPSVVGA